MHMYASLGSVRIPFEKNDRFSPHSTSAGSATSALRTATQGGF